MEVINDINSNKGLIELSINKYGYCAEHNYYCFLYNIESWEQPHIFRFEDDALVLAKYDTADNEWYVFVGVLASDANWLKYFYEFLEYCFSKNASKVWVEFTTEKRKDLLAYNHGYDRKYKINRINYTLEWPVFKMDEWTGDRMEGKDWKDLRYYWNKFFREHKVEFREYIPEDKTFLKELVDRWKKERNGTDRTYDHYYLKAIDNDFLGYNTRVIIVDDKICGITAGYKLTNRNYYYSSIGLIVKEFDRIGEIANMDDLITLKKKGHEFVDFGGGEPHLTEFKKKFRPSYFYKTHVFSIQNDKNKKD